MVRLLKSYLGPSVFVRKHNKHPRVKDSLSFQLCQVPRSWQSYHTMKFGMFARETWELALCQRPQPGIIYSQLAEPTNCSAPHQPFHFEGLRIARTINQTLLLLMSLRFCIGFRSFERTLFYCCNRIGVQPEYCFAVVQR